MGLTNPKTLWGVCLLLQMAGPAYAASDDASPDASEDTQRQVLHLRTEFLPYRTDRDGVYPFRQCRELIRQAMLLSARDEMGAATCDETLHETPPRVGHVLELRLVERADANRNWRVKLASPDGGGPVFEKTYTYSNTAVYIYSGMIPILDVESRGAFVEALQAAGLRKREQSAGEARDPGAEIEELLRQVDLVAQYAAVRAAHRAIAEQGESPAWLGVLVRGYANLAMLTRHQWCTATEVFAARSWLYAQRMMVRCEESRLARWHRAYAWTLTGTLHLALDDLRQLGQLEVPAGDAGDAGDAAGSPEVAPSWTRLIGPYSQCDRQALKQVGDEAPELKPWALRMWFELTSAYGIGTWVTDAAEECATVIPTATGVFADTAIWGAGLGTTRMAAAM
ncbi:MAG: hypothetical protein FJ276_29730, partial [Planctomycetes bacterium]|nr:hypothetical protein [Planctomycetota bacterium]